MLYSISVGYNCIYNKRTVYQYLIFFRLDTKNTLGYDWLLISWTPDSASVRFKMLYASTKATLKNEFGTAHIKDELHATTMVMGILDKLIYI